MPNSSTLKTYLGITETHDLLILPLQAASLATRLTTPISGNGKEYRFPLIVSDPSAAWVAENAEIPVSEAVADEITVIPKKLAGLSVISNELAHDTSPEAAGVIGDGLARDLARKLDDAFFGTAPANQTLQPGGLEYLGNDVQILDDDPASGLNPYIDALAAAESVGATVSAFVTDPATAKALAKLTIGGEGGTPLFGTGATNGIQRQVLGVPLMVSPHVLAGTAWAIPEDRIYTVIREDVEVKIDESVYFTSDRTAIRAILRVGFGFVQPEAIVRIRVGA